MPKSVVNLLNEPEILDYHKTEQLLTEGNIVPNVFFAVGYASRCWKDDGTFDTQKALKVANELCAYIRLIKEGKING